MAERSLHHLASRCEDTAADWTSRYFIELDGGKRADPELLKGAEVMMRLGAGFRDIARRPRDADGSED